MNPLKSTYLTICGYLLKKLAPDQDKLNGELVQEKLQKELEAHWIVLKDINNAVDERFGGGIHGSVGGNQVLENVRMQNRAWKLADLRNQRVANALQVRLEDVVDETKELISEVDELNKVKDAVLPSLRVAAEAVAKVEAIEESMEKEKEKSSEPLLAKSERGSLWAILIIDSFAEQYKLTEQMEQVLAEIKKEIEIIRSSWLKEVQTQEEELKKI